MKKNYCPPQAHSLPLQPESIICASKLEENTLEEMSVVDYDFEFLL